MKKIMTVTEVDGEGLEALLGERVVVWCMNYIYAGTLTGVNTHDILLENAGVVYNTGKLTAKTFEDFQEIVGPLYVRLSAVEAYYKQNV